MNGPRPGAGATGLGLGLRTCALAAVYGFCLGSAHSDLYAARNLVKFPLLLAVTAAVCALSHWLLARALLVPLGCGQVQRAIWQLFHDASLLLASLAPVVFFVGRSLRATDDGRLGGYDTFLGVNVLAIGAAGSLALVRQARDLLRERAVAAPRARALVAGWLVLSLAVGGQAAFYLRPFFGLPATRGGDPPFLLGAAPDLRGATNFYEAVWQTVVRPPLRGFEPR